MRLRVCAPRLSIPAASFSGPLPLRAARTTGGFVVEALPAAYAQTRRTAARFVLALRALSSAQPLGP